jgi:hypothetical protein
MIRKPKGARRRGLATVEMALVLPLLLLLIFGAIDCALQIHVMHRMTNAAREAARSLAIRQGSTTEAISQAQGLLSDIQATFTVTATEPTGGSADHDVVVHISVPRAQVSIGGFGGFFGTGKINAEVTMRKEGT